MDGQEMPFLPEKKNIPPDRESEDQTDKQSVVRKDDSPGTRMPMQAPDKEQEVTHHSGRQTNDWPSLTRME